MGKDFLNFFPLPLPASALFIAAQFCFPDRVEFRKPLADAPSATAWVKAQVGLRAKGGHTCPAEAYDFSRVPDAELESCVYYEYARESALIVGAIDPLRKQLREHGKVGAEFSANFRFSKFRKKFGIHFDAYVLLTLAGCSGFPQNGWATLSDEDHEIVKNLPGGAIQIQNRHFMTEYPPIISETSQDGERLTDSTLRAWVQEKTPVAMLKMPPDRRREWLLPGFFMVNFVHPPERIVESFRKWLFKLHPRAKEKVPEKRGRNSNRDRLNALCAMRLRFCCRGLIEAQDLTTPLRKVKRALYYSDRTAWNRACNRAVVYFREVVYASKKQFPIHHSAGWQK